MSDIEKLLGKLEAEEPDHNHECACLDCDRYRKRCVTALEVVRDEIKRVRSQLTRARGELVCRRETYADEEPDERGRPKRYVAYVMCADPHSCGECGACKVYQKEESAWKVAQALPFCLGKWVTEQDGVRLEHHCYLDKGHHGPCVCGSCDMYPLERHPRAREGGNG